MRRALAIVGKAPRPGEVKTRLVPPLSAEDAAALASAFLLDTVALGLSLEWDGVVVVHPAEDGEALRELLPSTVELRAQREPGLAVALREAFETCFAAGFERVVLVDSDSPTLPPTILHQGCERLGDHDATIGPSADGGYYLLGLRRMLPRLFEDIAWSTSSVYEQTLHRAIDAGASVLRLPEWYDVDTPADLARLGADLAADPQVAPRTRAVMRRLRNQPNLLLRATR
jgi:uncharacterized protein